MPLYVHDLRPAISIALAQGYGDAEWAHFLSARAEAQGVRLGLGADLAEVLRGQLERALATFAHDRFPVRPGRATPPDSPWLRLPVDLEASADDVSVARGVGRRVTIVAGGELEGARFRVTIEVTPEQAAALMGQISERLQAGPAEGEA